MNELKNEIKIESILPSKTLSDVVREFHYLQIDSNIEQTIVAIDDGCYDFMFYKEKYATLEFEKTNYIDISSNFFNFFKYLINGLIDIFNTTWNKIVNRLYYVFFCISIKRKE